MARAISPHVGLTEVDPTYKDLHGALTACQADANHMASLAPSRGFETTELLAANPRRRSARDFLGARRTYLRQGSPTREALVRIVFQRHARGSMGWRSRPAEHFAAGRLVITGADIGDAA
jgi:hypothetical protein